MTDCQYRSLLPHPTAFEADLEAHAAKKYCQLDADIIRRIHDPANCPAELLPWLAYALSVDVWNDKWPESTKRAVCANSLEMHRFKGTHGGVVDALAALGIRTDIVYWHEMQPEGEPGTMVVTLWVNTVLNPEADIIIGQETVRDVLEQLNSSKRASIHYTFRLAAKASRPVGFAIAATGQMAAHQTTSAIHASTHAKSSRAAVMGIATTGQLTTRQRFDARSATQHANTHPAVIRIAGSAQMVTHLQLEARL